MLTRDGDIYRVDLSWLPKFTEFHLIVRPYAGSPSVSVELRILTEKGWIEDTNGEKDQKGS